MNNYTHPIDLLVHCTLRIECQTKDGPTTGSGYIYAFQETDEGCRPYIVTNKHVIEGALKGKFHLTLAKEDGSPDIGSHSHLEFDNFEAWWIKHPNPDIDLAIFPIGVILNAAKEKGTNFYFQILTSHQVADSNILSSISTMEDIVMIGYPNGLWDSKHNLPIIRRGVTATHPKLPLNEKPEFLIDAACFPGSSGSPVFLANIGSFVGPSGELLAGNRIALLGTLYAGPQHTTSGEIVTVTIPTSQKVISVGTIPNNLGYVIQANELLAFEELVNSPPPLPFVQIPRNQSCPCGSNRRYKTCCGKLN